MLAVLPVLVVLPLKHRGDGIAFHGFCSGDLDLDPMTFIYEFDPYPQKTYRTIENEHPTSGLSKVVV